MVFFRLLFLRKINQKQIWYEEKEMASGWYLGKNHKHYHSNMIFLYLFLGVFFLFFGNYFISTSVLIAILSFLMSSISFVYAVYHIKKQIKKNRLKKENKTNTKSTWKGIASHAWGEISLKTPNFLLSNKSNC